MFDDEEEEEDSIPISRRSHVTSNRDLIGSQNDSPFSLRSTCRAAALNNSFSSDSFAEKTNPNPVQLIGLYEKTLELVSKNKISVKNAFEIPLVERLPEILELVAFEDEPNFVKAGSLIDTRSHFVFVSTNEENCRNRIDFCCSAKIYGFRVDALHTETQKLNGTFQQEQKPEETQKKIVQKVKSRSNCYIVSDLSSISSTFEFDFHPLQPSSMCHWPGGVGFDSIYGDMVSQTMYSSSDFPSINGFINFNSRVNRQFDDNQTILDLTVKTTFDLVPLRETIKDDQEFNHFLSSQTLREFSFNEDSTNSYIETIDECSLINTCPNEINFQDDGCSQIFSELRDDPSNFYFHQLLSTHTCPTTMLSMEMTSRFSFVDQIPNLLRDKESRSDYHFYDAGKLRLFAGPFLWRYKNLLGEKIEADSARRKLSLNRRVSKRKFRIDFHRFNKKSLKNSACQSRKLILTRRNSTNLHQLKMPRKIRSINELCSLQNFHESNLEFFSSNVEKTFSPDENQFDEFVDDPPSVIEPLHYDFIRPVHYEKIEIERNVSKIDAKKLQHQLAEKVQQISNKTTINVLFSDLMVELFDQGILSTENDQIVSAFYCMLNNCHKNQWFMKNSAQLDDLSIENEPKVDSLPLTYSHKL